MDMDYHISARLPPGPIRVRLLESDFEVRLSNLVTGTWAILHFWYSSLKRRGDGVGSGSGVI